MAATRKKKPNVSKQCSASSHFNCYAIQIQSLYIYTECALKSEKQTPSPKPQAKAKQVYFKMQFTLQNNRGMHKLQIAARVGGFRVQIYRVYSSM